MSRHAGPASTLVKKDLVEEVAGRFDDLNKAQAQEVVQMVLNRIASHVGAGGRVEFREHFVLEVREQAPRSVRNPRTGERVMLPGRRVVRFRPGQRIRNALAELAALERTPVATNGQLRNQSGPTLRIVANEETVDGRARST